MDREERQSRWMEEETVIGKRDNYWGGTMVRWYDGTMVGLGEMVFGWRRESYYGKREAWCFESF